MRVRGYISIDKYIRSITCCENVVEVLIDGKSLYDLLDNEFGLDPEKDFNNIEQSEKYIGVSYLILDSDPGDGDFENIIGEWIVNKLYSEYVSGCYSEYTCGFGGYNYFINGGHNIFNELSGYEGKYILLDIDDSRTIAINSILN